MNYLEQLFFDGIVKKEDVLTLGDKEIKVVFKTLAYSEQLEIDEYLGKIEKPTQAQIIREMALEVLSKVLLQYGETLFTDPGATRLFLSSKSATLVEYLAKMHSTFEREVQEFITPEEVEETFSETPKTSNDSEQ